VAASKKKVTGYIKLQLPAGKANPAPPVGPALGQHGVNIMGFCKDFNAKSAKLGDTVVPVIITVYADRSYTFVMKSAPASILLKKAAGLATSGKPGAGARDRQYEARGHERPHRRSRRAQHRGHGAQHGPRGHGLIALRD